MDMKSLSILGSAIWLMAFAALNTTAPRAPGQHRSVDFNGNVYHFSYATGATGA
jgi:hypothetical protein